MTPDTGRERDAWQAPFRGFGPKLFALLVENKHALDSDVLGYLQKLYGLDRGHAPPGSRSFVPNGFPYLYTRFDNGLELKRPLTGKFPIPQTDMVSDVLQRGPAFFAQIVKAFKPGQMFTKAQVGEVLGTKPFTRSEAYTHLGWEARPFLGNYQSSSDELAYLLEDVYSVGYSNEAEAFLRQAGRRSVYSPGSSRGGKTSARSEPNWTESVPNIARGRGSEKAG